MGEVEGVKEREREREREREIDREREGGRGGETDGEGMEKREGSRCIDRNLKRCIVKSLILK